MGRRGDRPRSRLTSGLRSVSDLVRTGYGWALVIKTGLLVVLRVLGALNAIRLHGWRIPGRGPSMTRPARTLSTRLIAVEAAVGAGLLVVVGVLAESVPPREEANELDLHGYTTGTHEPRKRPIRTGAHSHTGGP